MNSSFPYAYFLFLFSFLFLSWGSFLNVVAYRLLHNAPFFGSRSRCPSCNKIIAWYDLVPVFSWFFLGGRCRWCKKPISCLYPLIEGITLISFWGLIYTTQSHYWLEYGILFSALIITIRTDLEAMIILRPFTLGIIPFGLLFSYYGCLPISLTASVAGATVGFFVLAAVRYLSLLITDHYGMGDGDPELLAAIGAFIGPWGCFTSLMIGSFCGSLIGACFFYSYGSKARKMPIPFGPLLAVGAIITVLFNTQISWLLFLPAYPA